MNHLLNLMIIFSVHQLIDQSFQHTNIQIHTHLHAQVFEWTHTTQRQISKDDKTLSLSLVTPPSSDVRRESRLLSSTCNTLTISQGMNQQIIKENDIWRRKKIEHQECAKWKTYKWIIWSQFPEIASAVCNPGRNPQYSEMGDQWWCHSGWVLRMKTAGRGRRKGKRPCT